MRSLQLSLECAHNHIGDAHGGRNKLIIQVRFLIAAVGNKNEQFLCGAYPTASAYFMKLRLSKVLLQTKPQLI